MYPPSEKMLMKKTENERVHQKIERFFSMKNAFYGLINAFCILRNAFFSVPHCYGMLSSQFKIVLLMNRKLSEPFFLEWSGKDFIKMRSLSLTFSKLLNAYI